MKKSIKIIGGAVGSVAALSLLIVGGVSLSKQLQMNKLQKEPLALPQGFTATAHAGALKTQANTLDSIEVCLEFICNGCIEVDVRFDADKQPILSHDDPESGSAVTTLEEAFGVIAQYPARVNLDLKQITNVPEIQRLAQAQGITGQLFFTGVSQEQAELVSKDAPEIPYYLNMGVPKEERENKAYLQTLADNCKRLGAIGINLNYREASALLVEVMHENGLLVSVWTVNKKLDMCRMLHLGVDNITSKQPDVLQELMTQWGK